MHLVRIGFHKWPVGIYQFPMSLRCIDRKKISMPYGLILCCLVDKERIDELVSDGKVLFFNTSLDRLILRCLVYKERKAELVSDGGGLFDTTLVRLILRCLVHKEREAELVSDGETLSNTFPHGLILRCLVQRENSDGEVV